MKMKQVISAFVESSSNTLHRILLMEQLEQNLQQQEKELKILYEVMTIASEETDSHALLARSLAVTLAAVQCGGGSPTRATSTATSRSLSA